MAGLNRVRAKLVLQDGSEYSGYSFGAQVSVSGEAVFQTGMVGYPESLTDPSYSRQLLVLTYPMIGNYGVPSEEEVDEFGISAHFESYKIHAGALLIDELTEDYSHWAAVQSLSDWMKKHNVPGIFGVDTRAITKRLRSSGSMPGKIVIEGTDPLSLPFEDPNKVNLVEIVSTKVIKEFNPKGDVKIIMVDAGLKFNQLRCFVKRGAAVKVVPWDYDFNQETDYDGLFISNGPGDPSVCKVTVGHLAKYLENPNHKPVFGICLGNQLLGRAIGANTIKLPFGNRGHNQPCLHVGTRRCFITSQNHGFAIDSKTLPAGWTPLFVNVNDGTNEGIIHATRPAFSVQFHPEATAGPQDCEPLFDAFLDKVRTFATQPNVPMQDLIHKALYPKYIAPVEEFRPSKVLILGSGGLTIGQAGEFDYSGSQAMKALKEEGIRTILINCNIATVQTMKGLADQVYFLPITPAYVESVIARERPDGLLLSFGGQTALNCGVKLYESGVLAKYNVKVLGTPVEAIVSTEDRKIFSEKLAEIGEYVCPNFNCTTVEEVMAAAEQIGFPVMMRSSYALGGLGSGITTNAEDLRKMAITSLANAPSVTLERSLYGWKELEYEVVRDAYDNTITVCNMENFDPVGIHTGESIVVAPSQTLDDKEYNMLRSVACKVVRHIGIVGECNIQYALDPHSRQYYIIEVNARLSRSSALASKATGYPLAYIAAKLALNKSLYELRNAVTKDTTACFEPSLDYCVVKVPRWDLTKFSGVNRKIGSAMKSVGEVMAIGRNFTQAFQKALRMVDLGWKGFEAGVLATDDDEIKNPTDQRPLVLATALSEGYSVDKLYEMTKIDRWFLGRCKSMTDMAALLKLAKLATLDKDVLLEAKRLGFSDFQISKLLGTTDLAVRQHRKSLGILPRIKQIDTVAAEWPAKTNYLYITYNGVEDDVEPTTGSVMVLGSGVYRIGSSVEFDYGGVGCVREARRLGFQTIMLNYNPETVSTDYDECDRLFFDELTFENVLDIYEREQPRGVVLSMGGQIPNNLATALAQQNVNVLGTSAESIDSAENRHKFSKLCDDNHIDQPSWTELASLEDAKAFADRVGYPVLMRPSYILSGTAMRVAHSAADIDADFETACIVSRDYPVVMSKFVQEAREIEVDAVAKDGEILVSAISEHIENAGVHSGDASIIHPSVSLSQSTLDAVTAVAKKIAKALKITGPFNIQFLGKGDDIKVIECNLRASRSFPFVSKVKGVNMISIATQVMLGLAPEIPEQEAIDRVGVKVAQFSFNRLAGADCTLTVDMMSTGEVACFGKTKEEAYLKAAQGAGLKIPKQNIFLSIGGQAAKEELLPAVKILAELGYTLSGSTGTAQYYQSQGITVNAVAFPTGADIKSAFIEKLAGKFELVLNIPAHQYRRPFGVLTSGYYLRRTAIDHGISMLTDTKLISIFANALKTVPKGPIIGRVDFKSSWNSVKLPSFVGGLVNVAPKDLSAVLESTATAGFSTTLAVTSTPIKTTETALATDVAFIYGGSVNVDLAATAADFSGIFLDFEADKSLTTASLVTVAQNWPAQKTIVAHAVGHNLASVILVSSLYKRAIHVVGVQSADDLALIQKAKATGVQVTASVSVAGLTEATAALVFANLAIIDAFDLTSASNDSIQKALPTLLTAVSQGKLTVDDIQQRFSTNPSKIFGLTLSEESYVELDTDYKASSASETAGRVSRVVVHGQTAHLEGSVFDKTPAGKQILLA